MNSSKHFVLILIFFNITTISSCYKNQEMVNDIVITVFNYDVNIDYTGTELTPDQVEIIRSKLQAVMQNLEDFPDFNSIEVRSKFISILKASSFKIIIETGIAYDGCKISSTSIIFHKDYLLESANDVISIRKDIVYRLKIKMLLELLEQLRR